MEEGDLVWKDSRPQKENLPPVVASPTRPREAVSPTELSVVLTQCNDLLALQERLVLSGIQRQRELAEREAACRVECEEVYSQLDVRLL